MKMKYTLLLLALLLPMLFITACNNQQPTGPKLDPFVGGTKGVTMQFIEGMPPTQEGAILDNGKTSFSIGLKLTNEGEHTIAEGDFLQLSLKGILPALFNTTDADTKVQLQSPLAGAKKNIDGSTFPGQFTTLSFDNLRYLSNAVGDIPKTFLVELCYDYGTKSTTPICLAGDTTSAIVDPQSQKICQLSGDKQTMNSGAPVQVTHFKQMPQGEDKISVIFQVEQVDPSGKIFKYNSANECDTSITNSDRNVVHVTLSLPPESNAQITCPGVSTGTGSIAEGDIILYEGNPRTVTCTIKGNAAPGVTYEDLLSVDLSYRFWQTSEINILIKDLGTSSS